MNKLQALKIALLIVILVEEIKRAEILRKVKPDYYSDLPSLDSAKLEAYFKDFKYS